MFFPVILIGYFQWGPGPEFAYAVIAYSIIQALDGNLLAPILLAGVVNLHPVAVIAAVLVFGGCDYIDPKGKVVWTNKSGTFTVPLLRFGPNLIPQPGALFRRSAFDKVGGLDTSFAWAFDFELLIKLSKIGKLSYLNKVLSSFRWHPESLSVEYRKKSVAEASRVRVSHRPALLKPGSFIWEMPVRYATLSAGNRVTSKARRIATKR
jgi:GT2 family glycosyltransferase